MKNFTQTLTTVFFAVLLFAFGMANAQTVHFDDDNNPTKATSITGLSINGSTYDVIFTILQEAVHPYGAFPGLYTFHSESDATDAATAVNAALNSAGALKTGADGGIGYELYTIIYESYNEEDIDWCHLIPGTREDLDEWISLPPEPALYNFDGRPWTIFTLVTGINEELSGVSISVYPNPASDVLNIEAGNDVQQVTLINPVGQVVYDAVLEANKTSIDLSEFSDGVYMVQLKKADGTVMSTEKVVIKN
jgi:hypothetical protein